MHSGRSHHGCWPCLFSSGTPWVNLTTRNISTKYSRLLSPLLNRDHGPVLEQLPVNMVPDVMKQGSEVEPNEPEELDAADELTSLRAYLRTMG
ncbi:MAG: hypothetical protein Ct9H300mP11_15170 [Chloroflexota bacterium]|nr:MAG: hypothetical protein Ct9H300mP11_15170 [Chloroflexota bacterium]